MDSKHIDSFVSSNLENASADNFFLGEDFNEAFVISQNTSDPSRRLNDYDFNLLKEDAYKDVSDDLFKLEYKIARVEEEIKDLQSQIMAAKDINDLSLVQELSNRQYFMQEDYEALLAMYKEKSLSAKLTGGILNFLTPSMKQNLSLVQKKVSDMSEKFLERLPKRFSTLFELKKSLAKLENINKSVDDLMTMNIPYGENIDKYDQLSRYIIKANSIQADISKYINSK